MRTTHSVRRGWVIGALGACMLVVSVARADVTTERPGSILIFPKVVSDGTRDTVIQITNTSNTTDCARCFYVNGQKTPVGVSLCSETDFDICLTTQQPTNWLVSNGRRPGDSLPGLSPGLVPPVPHGFTGALVCAEVDASLAPIAMNALKGEATLEGPGPDLSKYNGIAFLGGTAAGANNGNNDLNLNGTEYNACPATSRVNFVAAGAPAPVISSLGNAGLCVNAPATPCGGSSQCETGACGTLTCVGGLGGPCATDADCPGGTCTGPPLTGVTTNVTVLPCNMDMNAQLPTSVKLNLNGFDGAEVPFSASTSQPLSCWGTFSIAPPLIRKLGTEFATLEITSGSGGPILAVVETFQSDSVGNTASAAFNTHMEGECVGACSNGAPCLTTADCGGATCAGAASIGNACSSNASCGGGLCSGPRFCVGGGNGRACTSDADCSGGTCPLPSAVIRLPGA